MLTSAGASLAKRNWCFFIKGSFQLPEAKGFLQSFLQKKTNLEYLITNLSFFQLSLLTKNIFPYTCILSLILNYFFTMINFYLRNAVATLCLLITLLPPAWAQSQADKKEWQPLFNGKDLSGWDIKIAGHALNDNYKNTFRYEDGMVRVAYDQYQNFDNKYGHMYYKEPYSHYILRFEYRFTGNQTPGGATWNVRNSGVMYHSQSAQSLTLDQEFPVSLEYQTLGGLGSGERHTGNLCTPGTIVHTNGKLNPNHCIDSNSKTYHGDRWVKAEIVVFGDSVIHHLVEGDTVFTFTKPWIGEAYWAQGREDAYTKEWKSKNGMALKEGYIALQAESHPIDFRNVEILNLKGCTDPKAKGYKSYYVVSDNKPCEYGFWEKVKRVFR